MARSNTLGSGREAAMIYAIPMLVSSASATFFCYLIANSFPTLRNRACRIVCLSCPVLLAALFLVFADELLNPLYRFLQGQGFHYDPGNSLAIIVASLLVVITLLAANLAAQIRILNRRGLDSK